MTRSLTSYSHLNLIADNNARVECYIPGLDAPIVSVITGVLQHRLVLL